MISFKLGVPRSGPVEVWVRPEVDIRPGAVQAAWFTDDAT